MKKSEKWITCVLSMAAALSLAACGSAAGTSTEQTGLAPAESGAAAESSEASEGSSGNGTNLSIMWWGSDARHEATQEVLDLYAEKTDVTFSAEYTGWDGYWQKLPVLAASNNMDDVLQMDAAYIHQYADNNQLADLTDLIDLSDVMSADELENYKIDGKLYGVPLSRNGQGYVYNKKLLDQYGIEEPENGWTMDEWKAWLYDARGKLPDGIYPLTDGRGATNSYISFQEYCQSLGGRKTLDGNDFNFDKARYIEFQEMYNQFIEDGIVPPAEKSLSFVELDPVNDSFINGSTVLRAVSVGSVGSLASMVPDFDVRCISLPQGDGGAGWVQSTIFFAVGNNSEHKQEAADFIKFFVTDVEAGKILKTVRGLPLSDEVYAGFEDDLTEYEKKNMELYQTITADGVRPVPYWDDVPTAFTDWNTEFNAQGQAIMLGETSIDKAADYLEEQGRQASEDAKAKAK